MSDLLFEEEILVPKIRAKKVAEIKKILEQQRIKMEMIGNLAKLSADDALNLMTAKNVVEAIGRGFEPGIAKLLFKEDFAFEQLSLSDYGYKRKNQLQRIRGILIGEKGKAKNIIEKKTGTKISIYGKTVSIIGQSEAAQKARRAIEMLLTGARHGTAYKYLEKDGRK